MQTKVAFWSGSPILKGPKRVTGSCFYVEVRDVRLLIDCGMFLGEDEEKNYQTFTFDPKKLDYVILTHAHIDHCGRIPLLVKEGFKGKIICRAL